MADFKHLKIYKDMYSLFLEYNKIFLKISKIYKYNVGEDIFKELKQIIEIIIEIGLVYNSELKISLLTKMIIKIEILLVNFRILKDLNQIEVDKYLSFCEKLNECMKQSIGLRKYHSEKIK